MGSSKRPKLGKFGGCQVVLFKNVDYKPLLDRKWMVFENGRIFMVSD